LTKRQEIENPRSCLNKGPETRLKFVIDATDAAAAYTIREWVKKRIALGKNTSGDAQTSEALNWANKVEAGEVEGEAAPGGGFTSDPAILSTRDEVLEALRSSESFVSAELADPDLQDPQHIAELGETLVLIRAAIAKVGGGCE
jgi:hypothetical protein